jgi:tRNA 2-thiouridine synthesizing protein A
VDPAVLTVDCVGLQCPAPILVLAKAAKKARRPALLEVHADDGDFAIDVRAWCRTTGAVLKSLLEVDGRFVAQIALEGDRTATDRPADERVAAPTPAPMQVPRVDVDCRGTRGPPMLQVDRAARGANGPVLLVVRSDDHRFPTDLEAWCKSAHAELIHLDGNDGSYVATVGWNGARLPTAPAAEPRVMTPERKSERTSARVSLLVLRDDPASVAAATAIAAASVGQGMEVELFLAHGAVSLVRRSPPAITGWLGWFRRADPPAVDLAPLCAKGVKVVVDAESLTAAGLARGDLRELGGLDVGTMAGFAANARGSALSLVF